MSELERYQPPQIADIDQWAEKLHASGMFGDAKSVAQAFVKIAAGAEIGLTPFQSMTGVHFINGKPVVGSGLLASLLDHAPYNYTVDFEPSIEAPTACTVTVFKAGKERGKSRFSLEDAQRAGLVRSGSNWEKYPSDMLFARAISQAARRYAPGATGTTFYVEGELTADVEVNVPEGVTAKPRTRVTAEVIPEHVEGEIVPDAPQPLRLQLTHMSAQEKGDLWRYAGLERNTKMADVKSRLIAYADELGLAYTEEPDARSILDAARADEQEALPEDAVEHFDRFAKTGEDLNAGDQATLDAEALT